MKNQKKYCLSCEKEFEGRSDKKFCDAHCKSAYQYRQTKQNPTKFYNRVDNQLKLNRKLLKYYNKSGKATVRTKVLLEDGFNPNFFTHYWRNKKGDLYLFVYEFGFIKRKEREIEKYVLI